MTDAPTPLQRLLARDRWIVGACLAGVCALAWLWLAREAALMAAPAAGGSGAATMATMAMARAHAPALLAADWLSAFVMWFLMMVAMMLPSAAPMILLYAAVARRGQARGVLAPTFVFAATYLLLWAAFSAAAAGAQGLLVQAGLVSAASLRLGGGRLAGGLLVAAGLYQVTPVKRACLAQCRSPMAFLTRRWRPGWSGAARLGLAHGASCVGCCWLLMALLFVGGVMSLAWVAVLAVVVLIEKIAPIGQRGVTAIGLVAIAAGGLLLIRG